MKSTDSVYTLLVYSLHGPSEKPAWFTLSCPCICADKGAHLISAEPKEAPACPGNVSLKGEINQLQ